MHHLDKVKNAPGVYLMYDLDGLPLYAGKSGHVRSRLKAHFVRQMSDVVADGLVDIYEVSSVAVWYQIVKRPLESEVVEDVGLTEPLDILEKAVIRQFEPRWNRKKPTYSGPLPDLRLIEPFTITIIDSPEELKTRRQPLQRIETRLLHMLRVLRKARISGASSKLWRALALHSDELSETCKKRARAAR